jgi:hypothetical protein
LLVGRRAEKEERKNKKKHPGAFFSGLEARHALLAVLGWILWLLVQLKVDLRGQSLNFIWT